MGSGRHRSASANRNAAVHAPIASPSDKTAAALVALLFINRRQLYTESARSESSHATTRASCASSRCFKEGPSALRASAGSRPSSIAASRCACSSSSISRFTSPVRNTFATRVQIDISRLPQHATHSLRHSLPFRLLGRELLLTLRGQLVDARAPSRILRNPLRAHPARLFHPMQRRMQRAFLRALHLGRHLSTR